MITMAVFYPSSLNSQIAREEGRTGPFTRQIIKEQCTATATALASAYEPHGSHATSLVSASLAL